MSENNYKEAAAVFANYTPDLPDLSAGEMTFTFLSGGLINTTRLVRCGLKSSFLLQQINTSVFCNPEDVQNNYISISKYAEQAHTGLRLPHPKYHKQNESLFRDKDGNYWRAFEFIEHAFSPPVAENPLQAKTTAKTFAKFTLAFDEFNTDQLRIVIPDFHNLSFRYHQFEESLKGEQIKRKIKATLLIEELKKREKYKHFYEVITESSESFPLRVMHHDAKIANVLFSKKTGKVICPVDFDTVMPGYYFSDMGDMIRSMACTHDENSIDFNNINIRSDFYNAILDGYLEVMKNSLTEAEKKYIHYAGLIMIYMQALRFMTDYLNGDIYYRIEYAEQNFDKAKNQLILLERLEDFLKKEFQFIP